MLADQRISVHLLSVWDSCPTERDRWVQRWLLQERGQESKAMQGADVMSDRPSVDQKPQAGRCATDRIRLSVCDGYAGSCGAFWGDWT